MQLLSSADIHHFKQELHEDLGMSAGIPASVKLEISPESGSLSGSGSVSAHKIYSKILLCEFCDATFASPGGLREHTDRIHLKKYPFLCDLCGKGFARKEGYNDHMNKHKNIKAHKCPTCLSSFSFETNLRRHLRRGVCSNKKTLPLYASVEQADVAHSWNLSLSGAHFESFIIGANYQKLYFGHNMSTGFTHS